MAGLRLGGVPIAKTTGTHVHKALAILEELKELSRQMGLPEYPRPQNVPTPLADIDIGSLSNRDLETHMAAYTAWATFLLGKVAEAEATYKTSVATLKQLKAELKVQLFKDEVPKSEIDARVEMAPKYMEYELEHLKIFATREILDAHYKAYAKQAQVLSRFVELRKLEFEMELRHHNVDRHRPSRGGLPQAQLRRR